MFCVTNVRSETASLVVIRSCIIIRISSKPSGNGEDEFNFTNGTAGQAHKNTVSVAPKVHKLINEWNFQAWGPFNEMFKCFGAVDRKSNFRVKKVKFKH